MKISQLTFAHEMGHNLGAKHDDDFKEETPACLPSVDDPKGNYIMFASATGGDKENNNKFSVCSVNSIARLLHQVLKVTIWNSSELPLMFYASFIVPPELSKIIVLLKVDDASISLLLWVSIDLDAL